MKIRSLFPRKLYYALHSDKNSELWYYLISYMAIHLPHTRLRKIYQREIKVLRSRDDQAYVMQHMNYYSRLSPITPIGRRAFLQESVCAQDQPTTSQKVYYPGAYRYARYFPLLLRWVLLPGGIVHIPAVPSITRSRLLTENNTNLVLMRLDKVRHFLFVNDRKPFREKQNLVVSRGLIGQDDGADLKQNRYDFVKRYYGYPLYNIGVIGPQYPQWRTGKLAIEEHLGYKFIMALEGNDVASNLKWMVSSNPVTVIPRPTCETWFMEGCLKPNYHYIEIKPDFSNLEERLTYYIACPEQAEAIIAHAHAYVDQFRNQRCKRLISLSMLKEYFNFTNPIQSQGWERWYLPIMNVQIVATNGAKEPSGHFRWIGNMKQPIEKTAEHAVGLIIDNLIYLR